mgnify:CR=1 FL=1
MCLPFRISGGFGHRISGKKARALCITEEFSPDIFYSHRYYDWCYLKNSYGTIPLVEAFDEMN